MTRPRLLSALASTALVLASSVAQAQDPPKPPEAPKPPATSTGDAATSAEDTAVATARARDLKKAGDRAMDALRFADAYSAYADVFAITRDPALLYNMGRALQALNRFPDALTRLEAFQAVASPELKAKVPRLQGLIDDLRKRVTTLKVTSNVPGARVLVDHTVLGKLPLVESLRLTSGRVEVEVEADGHFTYHTTLDLPGGGEAKVEAKLYSKSNTGLLIVRASAAGSTVFVDDQKAGLAPVELNVPGGTHRIRVKNPDFRDYDTTTTLNAGSTKALDVKLLPPSVFTRWWFWGSVALAGATAGVVGYAATTERAADRGDIAPGQVRTSSAPVRVTVGVALPPIPF
jgi:hypothetical protein